MKEITVSAKNVDAAIAIGAEKLGKSVDEIEYEVIEEGKKGILGFGAADAKVRVYFNEPATPAPKIDEEVANESESTPQSQTADENSPETAALNLLNTIIKDMQLTAEAKITNTETVIPEGKQIPEKNVYIEIFGDDLGSLIGRHGDVLDSLQYLANIAAGRKIKSGEEKKEYVKICLDIENYRAKREETLKALARRMADKAVRYHRNITLEPMLAYERKIIHAELQNYDGVFTYSVGSDSDRKVVIALGTPENPIKPRYDKRASYGKKYRNYDSESNYSNDGDYGSEE